MRNLAINRSSRIKLDRFLKTLELVRLGPAAREVRLGALIDLLRDKNLVGAGGRLRPGSGVDHGSDRRQVAMRAAEFAKAEFSAVNADAYPEIAAGEVS